MICNTFEINNGGMYKCNDIDGLPLANDIDVVCIFVFFFVIYFTVTVTDTVTLTDIKILLWYEVIF